MARTEDFNVDIAIIWANALLMQMEATTAGCSEEEAAAARDKNLIIATTVQKLVGAATAWKATRMTDLASQGLSELMNEGGLKSMSTSHGHSTAHLAGQEDEDDDRPSSPRNLEELKARLNLNKKTDKRW